MASHPGRYSKERFERTMAVFREAWEHAKPNQATFNPRHLRNDYNLRAVAAGSAFADASGEDDDDRADEYEPGSPKKRRGGDDRAKAPKPKRVKHDRPRNPAHTSKEDSIILPSLVTLKVKTATGQMLLSRLAGEHGTGYNQETHTDKQEEENVKIAEGTIRSDACLACEKNNKRCSVKKDGEMPCQRCIISKIDCVMNIPEPAPNNVEGAMTDRHRDQHMPPPPPVSSTTSASANAPQASGQATDQADSTPGASRDNPILLDSPPATSMAGGATFFIQTPWAHPMNFQHLSSAAQPCHFCKDFRFGLYGHGVLRVEVFLVGPGKLEEAGDGHRAQGQEPTRMCVHCSLERMYIMRCGSHAMRRFGCHFEPAILSEYTKQINHAAFQNGPPIKQAPIRTCRLCVLPATWECCASQQFDQYRRKLEEKDKKGRGCGLILCESCAASVKVDGVLKTSSVLRPNGDDFRRADMEFLFAGSLLHNAYHG